MMKSIPSITLNKWVLLLVFFSSNAVAELIAPECQVLDEYEEITAATGEFDNGLLWKISKAGSPHSYVFGTIHVSDESIVKLPEEVSGALNQAKTFAMEVVPEPSELMTFASLMYFSDGRKLNDLISEPLFDEVVKLLASYHLPEEAVELLKPWAAFLTMSYPPEFGQVLDMQLLEKARQLGVIVTGLESMQEQIDIFNTLTLDHQIKILSDTACHYDMVEADFTKMKSLYIARDLGGLYAYSQRYSLSDEEVYNVLIKKILVDRNYTMTERMQPMLESGNAFIAIGAMHLPGEEGVLSLLAKNDYEISLVY
ncbi:MAG: TraB/GumN family protein [Gammaproteobacteria bacterium]|jgi:uncharacterized protein|nr:TraB/GumN family protein [Gammaproteobacteria bacterium]